MRLAPRLVAFVALLLPGSATVPGCSECAVHEQTIMVSSPDPDLEAVINKCVLDSRGADPRTCDEEGDDCACRLACERLLDLTRPAEERTIQDCRASGYGVTVTYRACR